MTVEVRPDIVTSLGTIRGDVARHLACVSRYRAMRNLEQTITDIAEFQELATPLREVREEIERQLRETRGYRALCAIDSIVPQLADVLAFLDEKSNGEVSPPNSNELVAAVPGPEMSSGVQILAVYTRADEAAPAENIAGAVESNNVASEPQDLTRNTENAAEQASVQPDPVPEPSDAPTAAVRNETSDDGVSGLSQISVTAEGNPATSDGSFEERASPVVATLAYNLANTQVPSPPATSGAMSAQAVSQGGVATTTKADHAAQENRAA